MVNPSAASAGDDGGNGEKRATIEIPFAHRFDPTDEELIIYLRNKIMGGRDDLPDFIPTTDVFGTSPGQLPFDSCKYATGKKWFFYTVEPNLNVFTGDGYWCPISEEDIHTGSRVDAYKKEFIYYRGMQRPGKKTAWCIHQYRLNPNVYAETAVDDDAKLKISNVVACKVFRKDPVIQSKRRKRKKY